MASTPLTGLARAAALSLSVMAGAATAAQAADRVTERVAESRAVAAGFMATLKGELMRAMEQGGPAAAIEVCSQVAPAIAAEASERTGWQVGRTSLRVRNPENAPDAWERDTLRSFERRKAAGEPLGELEAYGVVEGAEGARFRWMKAIPTGEPCLACHGSDLAPQVRAALAEAYPADAATGFALGDIRGAFTIVQPW